MKKLHFIVVQIIALSIVCVTVVFANSVSLDTTFNSTGYTISSPVQSPLWASADSMAVQPDGKKVIGGQVENLSTNQSVGFLVMRQNADGTPDTTFGTNGSTITPVDLSAAVSKVLILPDGKILLSGTSFAKATEYDFAVIRYNADGSLDTSFNGTGYVTKTFDGRSFDECRDMALQPDGKIVLVGNTAQIPWTGPTLDFNFAVMRLNSDGSLDTTFNGTGKLTVGTQEDVSEYGYSVLVNTSGKIIVGGVHSVNQRSNFRMMRFNANGTTDSAFGVGGSVSTSVSSTLSNSINTMALQSDGKILASGYGGGIVRYTTNGVLDTTFGINGIANAPHPVNSIRIIGGDKILAVGHSAVLRFLNNGARDTKFQYTVSIPGNECSLNSVNLDNDNKIVVGGNCGSSNNNKPLVFRIKETLTKRFLSFYGSEKTNYSLYRPSTREWIYTPGGNAVRFGLETDRPAPADFTGDGRADIAVFRPSTGEWFVLRSDNGTFYSFRFGASEDIPVADDYDGDQIADAAVFRPSTNQWFILKSTGGVTYENFGLAGDKPVASDYDGDFKTDIAVYRPSSGQWWIHKSSNGSIYSSQFGTSSDKPVPGDYTGDGKTDMAVWRASTGEWFILRSEDSSHYGFRWGLSDDLPTPGDYIGDSRFDAAVYRPSINRWYVMTPEGSIIQQDFGISGDLPVPNFFVR